jgi:hypothetical protein
LGRRNTANSIAGYSIASMGFAPAVGYVTVMPAGRRTQPIPRVTPGQSTNAARGYRL